jgi:hypothetical protein
MAVKLRCPDCRAELKLKAAPEAGTEIECPKCGTVFEAPEPEPEEKPEPAPEKKEKKTKTKKAKTADPAVANAPKKRKAKKRETSKAALIAVISTGVIMVISVTVVLIWFFTRTSKSIEMMYYVPEDSQEAIGMNIGHAQKYPEFYKSLQSMHNGTDYKAAGDAIAKAAGLTDMDALVEYMVKAQSKKGSAIVFRTKAEFDAGALDKLPGKDKKTMDGKTYYLVPGLTGTGERYRVFSPTNRLVVVSPESTQEGTFKKMLNGHGDNKDNTLGKRAGELGKRLTRGTIWVMTIFDNEVKAPTVEPPAKATPGTAPQAEDSKVQLARTVADTVNGARGFGIKASLGSRELRFEICVWYKDPEKAVSVARKWKESELGKGDEGTPPTWFKDSTQNMGDRKVATQLLSNIGFGAAGDVFFAKSAVETVDFQQGAGGALGKMTGQTPPQGGGGGPGPPPGGGPMPAGPPKMRRRFPVRVPVWR